MNAAETEIRRSRSTLLALLALLSIAAGLPAAMADGPASAALPELSITLAPGGVDEDGDPSWLDVETTISGFEAAADAAFLRTPVKFAGVDAVHYEVDDIAIADDAGEIPLEATVDDPDAGGFLYWARWSPARPTQGDITLTYRAPIELVIPRLGSGPPFDLRAQGGGLSGAANTFMIMPDTSRPFTIRIRWDLDALAPRAIGVSSFGEGDTEAVGPVDRLIATFLVAGPLGRYPADAANARFSAYWIGEPRFDAARLAEWSEMAYEAIAGFFDDRDPAPFRVMMRPNPYQGGGGSALMNSYLLSFPETQTDADALRETIAHETLHNWVGSIPGPPGSTSWFSEGMTVHYTRLLLLRSGLFSADEFLESVNGTASSYYTNALNDLPNDRIAERFWEDTRVRTLPYTRGSLYFADVGAKLRRQSGGTRSLDDLLKEFTAIAQSGEPATTETWLDLVVAALGPEGQADFEAMLAGELVVPPSDAFGPCFAREATKLRRFDLGFDRTVLVTEPRVVAGLDPDSGAWRAGLRNGDEILHPVALEEVQSDTGKTLVLEVRRGERTLTIEYLPRAEEVEGYRWVRKAGVPDEGCGQFGASGHAAGSDTGSFVTR